MDVESFSTHQRESFTWDNKLKIVLTGSKRIVRELVINYNDPEMQSFSNDGEVNWK
jgi:hypothetical protein